MKPVLLQVVSKSLKLILDNHPLQLPKSFQSEVETFWSRFNYENRFTNGEVFHIDEMKETDQEFVFDLKSSNYAHYLYSVKTKNMGDHACRVIYGAGLVETSDSYFVFGEMNDQTAYPGRLQCVGGGLSRTDLHGNQFQLQDSVLREMTEELGIHLDCVSSCSVRFLKTGGDYDFLAVLFHVQLNLTNSQLEDEYNKLSEVFLAIGEKSEFVRLVSIKNEPSSINDFIDNNHRDTVDYLIPLLNRMK
ncbi:hypothetical protein JYA63_10020 [Fictibacillus nanhaiensis]|uniref:Nudix hydrolase domain-containing protein n=1 Tax=Fictibacillus nanhaiensis TaxID=742169 RepID=A0ABS2ZR05_9BACL|nr:hypothetical protein [Fictibacillus nanhaiensis]